MDTVICGIGPMGRAAADELALAGHAVRPIGRPVGGATRHPPEVFARADVTFDFSAARAVAENVASSLEGGCRRFVIGTTGWDADRTAVDRALRDRGAAAVVAPTFSPGATLLLSLVGQVASALGRLGGYDPYLVEWHRAGKRDRPSGTANELARRLIGADPAKRRIGGANDDGPADPEALEVVSLRAGSAPGRHVVGWDAAGETVELVVTARDRRAYAAGARSAAEWLLAARRPPGIHSFESVIAELLDGARPDTILTERTAS